MHSVRENKHNDISINNASKFKAVKLQQSKTGKLKKREIYVITDARAKVLRLKGKLVNKSER